MKFLTHDGLLYFWRKVKSYVDTKYNELFQSVSNGKTTVANAITDKGVATSATDTFATMANNINNITTGVDTADATAIASDILSGKTAYVNGNKITGNIVSKGAATITPTTSNQTIAAKQYLSGAQTIQGDANLIANNIVSGKSIFGVAGTYNAFKENLFNFPMTISTTQPTASTNGHIWINSNKSISKVQIVESLPTTKTNGTIYFVVGDLALRSYSYSNNKSLTNGSTISFSINDNSDTSANWLVFNSSGIGNLYLRKPIVYSYVNNVLDIETAYMWNSSTWVLLSQTGTYMANATSDTNVRIYTLTGDTYATHSNLTIPSGGISDTKFSADGTYLLVKGSVYKRTGNVFTQYTNFNASSQMDISRDGTTIIICKPNSSSVDIYKNNGTTFIYSHRIYTQKTSYSDNNSMYAGISSNGQLIVVGYRMDDEASTKYEGYYADSSGTFTSTNYVSLGSYTNEYSSVNLKVLFSNNGKYVHVYYRTSNGYAYISTFLINYTAKTLASVTGGYVSSSDYQSMMLHAVIGDVILYSLDATYYAKNLTNNTSYTVTFADSSLYTGNSYFMTTNAAETRLLANCSNSPYGIYMYSIALNHTNKTLVLTRVFTHNQSFYWGGSPAITP